MTSPKQALEARGIYKEAMLAGWILLLEIGFSAKIKLGIKTLNPSWQRGK